LGPTNIPHPFTREKKTSDMVGDWRSSGKDQDEAVYIESAQRTSMMLARL
jgi:hypothetical protein